VPRSRFLQVLIALGVAAAGGGMARAQPGPSQMSPGQISVVAETSDEAVVQQRSATWPMMTGIHVLMGVEPHDRGNPAAFGVGLELLWKARIGGFVALLASAGTPIVPPTVDGVQQPALGDRISVPFGVAARPLAPFARDQRRWANRLLTGVGVQLGLTIEHLRTSDESATTAGLHVGLGVDVPLYGGPVQGGVALRVALRGMFAPEIWLDNRSVFSGVGSMQVFGGITYYP
jgi:hypothetical protein